MTRNEFLFFKAKLLCYGISIDSEAYDILFREHPEFFEKGFINAMNLAILGSNICVSVAERFSAASSIHLVREQDGNYAADDGQNRLPVTFFPTLPKTGTVVDQLARLHSPDCINLWPSTACCYDKPDLKCRFCSLQAETPAPVDPDELAEGLSLLLPQYPIGHLNFSGGTYRDPDTMADYWCRVATAVRRFSDCKIAVEFAPPSLPLLSRMKESGIDVAIMNLEIADPVLRRKICPGKSALSYEHYYDAMLEAVRLFGFGQVSSVLIGGIQPESDILTECRKMAKIGVYPTIIPFRPLDDCAYTDMQGCDPGALVRMGEELGAILRRYRLNPDCQPGCTKCGGCSIENDCYREIE